MLRLTRSLSSSISMKCHDVLSSAPHKSLSLYHSHSTHTYTDVSSSASPLTRGDSRMTDVDMWSDTEYCTSSPRTSEDGDESFKSGDTVYDLSLADIHTHTTTTTTTTPTYTHTSTNTASNTASNNNNSNHDSKNDVNNNTSPSNDPSPSKAAHTHTRTQTHTYSPFTPFPSACSSPSSATPTTPYSDMDTSTPMDFSSTHTHTPQRPPSAFIPSDDDDSDEDEGTEDDSTAECVCPRKLLLERQSSFALTLQRIARGKRARVEAGKMRSAVNAVCVLQRTQRRRRRKQVYERQESLALTLQRLTRGALARRRVSAMSDARTA